MIEQIFGVTADTTMDVGNTITYMLIAAVFGVIIGGVYFAVCKKERRYGDCIPCGGGHGILCPTRCRVLPVL